MRTLLTVAALLSLPATAGTLVLMPPQGVRLSTGEAAACEDADVCVTSHRLEARFGIRWSPAAAFAPAAPIVLDADLSAKDASGKTFTFRVRQVAEGGVELQLTTANETPPAQARPRVGTYRVQRARILGQDTDSRYPDLTLFEDGTFRMGSTSGTWSEAVEGISLSGHFLSWGPGEVDTSTHALTFRFRRGEVTFEVTLAQVVPEGQDTPERAVVASARPLEAR